MANHNKNKRFGGDNFQPVRRAKSTGQEALERDYERKMERNRQRRSVEDDEDFYSTYEDLD